MAEYVWQHDLEGERNRLRLMSDLLDPLSEFHLTRTGVTTGWRCLEIGAGNGSLSQWLAQRVGPAGHVIASDIRTDLMEGIAGGNLDVCKFDVVHDEPPGAPYDLVAVRARRERKRNKDHILQSARLASLHRNILSTTSTGVMPSLPNEQA